MKFRKPLVMMLLFCSHTIAETGNKIVVKKNETLSNILWNLKVIPLYGKNGKIKKILSLNPHLRKKSFGGHILRPGDVIELGEPVPSYVVKNHEMISESYKEETTRSISSNEATQNLNDINYSVGFNQSYHTYEVVEKNGEKGTIASGLTPGLILESNFLNTYRSRFKFQFSYQYLSLLGAKDIEIKQKTFLLTGLNLDYRHRIFENYFFHVSMNNKEHLFFEKGNSPVIDVYKTNLRSFELGVSGKWDIDKRYNIQPMIRFSYYPKSSNQGFGFTNGQGFDLKFKVHNETSFFIEPFYSSYKLSGNDRDYNWNQLGLVFGRDF